MKLEEFVIQLIKILIGALGLTLFIFWAHEVIILLEIIASKK